jgi:hypothetical protein
MTRDADIRFLENIGRKNKFLRTEFLHSQTARSVLQFHEEDPVCLRRFKGQHQLLSELRGNLSGKSQKLDVNKFEGLSNMR